MNDMRPEQTATCGPKPPWIRVRAGQGAAFEATRDRLRRMLADIRSGVEFLRSAINLKWFSTRKVGEGGR